MTIKEKYDKLEEAYSAFMNGLYDIKEYDNQYMNSTEYNIIDNQYMIITNAMMTIRYTLDNISERIDKNAK